MTRRSAGPTSSAATQHFDPKLISDPVVRRADGSWLYLLPSVIDDIDLAVTHVVRGEDHVSNSAVQLQMFAALGAEPPAFAHEALLVAAEGKLSKRLGSYGAEHLREEGVEPMALLSLLARHRHFAAGRGRRQSRRARARASISRISAARRRISIRTTSSCSTPNCCTIWISPRSPTACPPARARPTGCCCAAISPILSDYADWLPVLDGTIERPDLNRDDRLFVRDAAAAAEAIDWSGEPWRALTDVLKERTGRKGRSLFMPLRLALTGRESGPEMAPLLARIGRDRAIARLETAASHYGRRSAATLPQTRGWRLRRPALSCRPWRSFPQSQARAPPCAICLPSCGSAAASR